MDKDSEDFLVKSDGNDKSVLDRLREQQALEEKALAEKEREALAEKARIEREERASYEKKLAQEKVELMKAKAGFSDGIVFEKEAEKEYTFAEKVGNFFYHNKVYIAIILAIAVLAAFLAYDILTKETADVTVLVIANDEELGYRTDDISEIFAKYTPDFDGDGKSQVFVHYLPAVPNTDDGNLDTAYEQANQTKLLGEFQMGDAVVVISDSVSTEAMGIEDLFSNMSEIYPDDENALTYGYKLNATSLDEETYYENMPDDLYITFRTPQKTMSGSIEDFERNYANALEMFDNYLNKNEVGIFPNE